MDKMQLAMKVFFFLAGTVMWIGIWLTGFDTAHWLLFLPASFFLLAAITGICPGLIVLSQIFKVRQKQEID